MLGRSLLFALPLLLTASADPLVGNHSATWEVDQNGAFVPPNPPPPQFPYESLKWQFISIPAYCGRYCAIFANSFPVYAAFNETVPATAAAKYPGSKVAAFDLKNFAYGCAARRAFTGPSGDGSQTYYVDAPVNCTLDVQGYRTDTTTGPPAMATTVRFTPALFNAPQGPGTPQANMQVYNVETFKGLRFVSFTPKLTKDNYPLAGPLKAYIDTINFRTFNFTA